MLVLPRLLLVENEDEFGDPIAGLLAAPSEWARKYHDLEGFRVDRAWTRREAEAELTEAAAAGQPYDAMLLDLGLPEDDKKGEEDQERGLRILRGVGPASCTAVVVYTKFTQMDLIRRAIRAGVADYVLKGSDNDEEVAHNVVAAYFKGQRERWARLRDEHARRWHLTQACGRVADRLARVVSDGIGTVLARANELTGLILDRYQLSLERDPGDPVCRALGGLRQAATATARRCAEVRGRLLGAPEEEVKEVLIDRTLADIAARFLPGIRCHRLHWELHSDDGDGHVLRTFPHDVGLVLQEMVFGAIDAYAERGGDWEGAGDRRVAAEVAWAGGRRGVEVTVTDTARPFPEATCDRIAAGEDIDPADRRAFGLSLAQRAAQGLGGRLDVTPRPSGNAITLRLPGIPNG